MKIIIDHLDEAYRYNFEHLIKLFYTEPQFYYHEIFDHYEALLFTVTFTDDGAQVNVSVELKDTDGRTASATTKRPQNEVKKGFNIALLRALENYTGVSQPWGILLGVRPLKLYHNRFRQGQSKQEIAHQLESEYLITPPKIKVLERIVDRQLTVLPDLYKLGNEVSIYIGIPFCPTKCAYCTFPAYSILGHQGSVGGFLAGLHEEIKQVGEWLQQHKIGVTTIYFGGGTPTSIEAEDMDALFETIKAYFPQQGKSRELTVEAGRPDTITPDKIDVMKKWYVDRISINPQSFTESTLKAIGRHHTVAETLEKYQLARELGMNNINMDLIIGLPNEGMDEFKHSLHMVQQLRPESLTVHTLSFKTASTMTRNRDRYVVASGDEVAEMIRLTEQWTETEGYVPYYLYRQKNILGNQENVGYALPGKESLYNIIIMEERETIIGLGCGASSKIISPHTQKITRFANPKEPKVYNENYQDYIDRKLELLNREYQFNGENLSKV